MTTPGFDAIANFRDVGGHRTADGSTVRREHWTGPTGERLVVYHVVGGGHSFPGGYRGAPTFLLGRTNRDIHGADEIWSFFFAAPR